MRDHETRHQIIWTTFREFRSVADAVLFLLILCACPASADPVAGALPSFTLSPSWFQTPWFRILSIACIVLMAWLLHQLRVRRITARINDRFAERLAEQNLIAEELHDTLLQGFLSASMKVHVARDQLPDTSPIKPTLTRSLELMAKVIEEGSNAMRGTRSTSAVSLDLENAFAQIHEESSPGSTNERPVGFRLIAEGPKKPFDPLLRDEVYRIRREALTNAFRHARANFVEIDLEYGSCSFRLLVRDDGCGIDPRMLEPGREGHSGLTGMRARADRMGAGFHVCSSRSAGTEVSLSVPGSIVYQDRPVRRLSWFR